MPADPLARGYDISHYQPASIHASRTADVFVFIKATDGLSRDKAMPGHHAAAGACAPAKARGPYHFYRANRDPEAQADFFADTTSPYAWELPHVIDYEDQSQGEHPDRLLACLTRLEARTGRTPILYTGPYWWKSTIGDDPRFARFPLWLARYPSQSADTNTPPPLTIPSPPAPWAATTVWQWTSSAGHLDRNLMAAADLAKFLHPSNYPDPPPPTPLPEGPLMALTDAEQTELLDKVRDLHDQWIGNKSDAKPETLRQIIKETRVTVGDIASGARPKK